MIFAGADFVNAVLLLVPLKSFEVRVQRTLSNLIDEIGNTRRRGKLSIISFVKRKLNPNNDGLHHKQKCTVLGFVHCCADWSSGAGQQSVSAPLLQAMWNPAPPMAAN
jgi:hypothetical protein